MITIAAKTSPTRRRRVSADQLRVLAVQPQGAPQIDSQVYGQEVDSSHPLNLRIFMSSDIMKINRGRFSFFIEAFRSPVAGANTVTSGASSASSSAAGSAHSHSMGGTATDNGDSFHHHSVSVGAGTVGNAVKAVSSGATTISDGVGGLLATDDVHVTHTHSITGQTTANESTHSHSIPHTHDLTPSLLYGIYEAASTLSGLRITVNGTDRTASLGGPWNVNVSELALDPTWFTIGAWNTVAVSAASGLGRVTGHLTTVSFVQSV